MNIGNKIKRLRLENNLTQEELASRCDLSKGFISLMERDLTSPSIATLVDILDTLGTNLNEFFSEEHDEKIVFGPEDIFTTQNEELGHQVSWLISNSQKNDMEPILIELDPMGVYTDEESHEGEEFGYCLTGQIEVQLGKKTYRIKKGESFYYRSNIWHRISNPYKRPATVLMISTPPSF
ncbi:MULTISPECIES: helix-turn-helix domain-containing protein [unclassified Fusibacter]|uniref:helix-turn-helix domain-containing protein n=1 Tax=unclassified Fusibacter TaxID=2624464 RepID=UPI001012462E|nr:MULTISPECIES: XRE family transcriptional regulator [unclassified Fusibacter]MCK8061192.1 XRE family transcriptional regulator [Fusibacter sp. A2]NPE23271.1 cupin domain-containing protein [Fusibacter sp. A1]RXV59315.1 cupin domain-containing protein [Fusibacter sp. A1]